MLAPRERAALERLPLAAIVAAGLVKIDGELRHVAHLANGRVFWREPITDQWLEVAPVPGTEAARVLDHLHAEV